MDNLKAENETLRARIADLTAAAATESPPMPPPSSTNNSGGDDDNEISRNSLGKAGLTAAEIARYSRHLLVPAVGVEGQR